MRVHASAVSVKFTALRLMGFELLFRKGAGSASWKINNRGGGGGRDELKVSLICCAAGAVPLQSTHKTSKCFLCL
jgi:hypothetical protein